MLNKKYKSYTIVEFLNEDYKELNRIDSVIGHIKKNKKLYMKLVFMLAITLTQLDFISYANGFESSLNSVGNRILNMLNLFARWGCLTMGLKAMITSLLNGSNLRHASMEGIQYWIGYLFIKLYPALFEMVADITF